MINKSENKIKTTWKIIKKETGKTQVLETNFQLKFEGKNTKNQNEVAYDCTKLFLSLAENLMTDHPNQYEVIKLLNKLTLYIIAEMKSIPKKEIEKMCTMKSFKIKNSAGHEGISGRLLKLGEHIISKPSSHISNSS
jgi:hypothetical protein